MRTLRKRSFQCTPVAFKPMIFRTLILCIVLLTFNSGQANGQSKVSTTASNFLLIGTGARNVGMGETAAATGRDLSGLYWNPALIADLQGHHVYFNRTEWFVDVDLNYASAMLNMGTSGRFAFTVYTLTSPEMEVITEERVQGTGELFRVQDMMIGLTYSRQLTDRFQIGMTAKYIRNAIWNMAASTGAVDVGFTYQTPYRPVTIGMSISNFGGEMRLTGSDTAVRVDLDSRVRGNNDAIVANLATNSWDLPVAMRFGVKYEPIQTRTTQVTLATDVNFSNTNNEYLNAGIEYGIMSTIFLRGGYRQLLLQDAEGGLGLGLGLNYRGIFADYAFADRGRLGSVQYISLGISL